MRTKAVLLTDLDNTLFSWIDYFGPSLRAMVDALSRETDLSEAELYRQFREVYRKHNAAEHPNAIDELEFCLDADSETRERLTRLGDEAFRRARRRHLQAYPYVHRTLGRLRDNDVAVIGVTSSSVYDAVTRAELLELAPLFDAIFAWEGIAGTVLDGPSVLTGKVIPVSTDQLKPNSHSYHMALEWCGAGLGAPVWVVGDSIANDLVPAKEIGATTVWARYGHDYEPENYNTVLQVTFWDTSKIKRSYDPSILTPDETIDCFSEVAELVLGACEDYGVGTVERTYLPVST